VRLMNQWFDEITLENIAKDAGVTVQTVIRRFRGKEGLLCEAVKILAAQINAQRGRPSGDLAALVDGLYADYERTGDALIRLLAIESRYPAIKRFTDVGRREHRQWISDTMAGPLRNLETAVRPSVVDALVIATDVYAWKLLRRDMGRSIPAAKKTTKSLVRAVIAKLEP